MFQEYKNKKLYNDFIYSPAVDLLLSWGRGHLFSPEDTETLQNIEREWNALRQETDIRVSVETGVAYLADSEDYVLNFFDIYPYIDVDSEAAAEVPVAMEILDHVVFLAEAVDAFPHFHAFPDNLQNKVKQLLEKATIDQAPSALRLIPLNEWRGRIVAIIPEVHRYLFSWYTRWHEVPPETIDLLIEHWQAITGGTFEGLEIDPDILESLLFDLVEDHDLLSYIRRQARIGALIPKAIEKSLALRLYITSDKEAANHAVPQEVEAKGLVACADRLVGNYLKKIETRSDWLESLFMVAFCGPVISDQDRIDLLSRVEDELKRLDHSMIKPGSVLTDLVHWADDKVVTGKHLGDTVFSRWLNDLSNIAVTPAEDEDVANAFLDTIETLKAWQPASVENGIRKNSLWDRVKAACFSQVVEMLAPPAESGAMAETTEEIEKTITSYSDTEGNIIDLPLTYKRGKLLFAKKQRENDALERLRENFLKKATFYWNAVYKVVEDPKEQALWPHPQEEDSGDLPLKMSAENLLEQYDYVVVCISPKPEIVEKAIAGQTLSDEEKKQIVFLRYRPEEQK